MVARILCCRVSTEISEEQALIGGGGFLTLSFSYNTAGILVMMSNHRFLGWVYVWRHLDVWPHQPPTGREFFILPTGSLISEFKPKNLFFATFGLFNICKLSSI